jgi:hypothetical protein
MPDPHTLDDLKHPVRGWGEHGSVGTALQPEFGVEELRLLIGRQQSLRRYVPLAIEILEQNPLAEGDYYPGDLLQAVLSVDPNYWRAHRDQWERADEIAESFFFAQARLAEPLQAFRARRI